MPLPFCNDLNAREKLASLVKEHHVRAMRVIHSDLSTLPPSQASTLVDYATYILRVGPVCSTAFQADATNAATISIRRSTTSATGRHDCHMAGYPCTSEREPR